MNAYNTAKFYFKKGLRRPLPPVGRMGGAEADGAYLRGVRKGVAEYTEKVLLRGVHAYRGVVYNGIISLSGGAQKRAADVGGMDRTA